MLEQSLSEFGQVISTIVEADIVPCPLWLNPLSPGP